MKDTSPMHCAMCNETYIYEQKYWPFSYYAECWKCLVKRIREEHAFALETTKAGRLGIGLFAFAAGFIAAMMVYR